MHNKYTTSPSQAQAPAFTRKRLAPGIYGVMVAGQEIGIVTREQDQTGHAIWVNPTIAIPGSSLLWPFQSSINAAKRLYAQWKGGRLACNSPQMTTNFSK